MQLTITINLDNAAFEDPKELGRILRGAAAIVDIADIRCELAPGLESALLDSNGNSAGKMEITD